MLTRIATPPKPALTIQPVPPDSVRLLWPINAVGYTLQSNTNTTTTNWAAVTPLPVVAGTNNVVTNTTVGPQKFYRLLAL
ncbi:MAG: hypothetical protein ACREUU_20320 [Gammaproteobacteria bacterium]